MDRTEPRPEAVAASALLLDRVAPFAAAATQIYFSRHPEALARWGEKARAHTLADNEFHLRYLAEALAADIPEIFTSYIDWVRVVLEERRVPAAVLAETLDILLEVLAEALPPGPLAHMIECLDGAKARLASPPVEIPTFLDPNQPHAALLDCYVRALLDADRRTANRLILDAANSGVPVRELYLHVFQPAQHEIGRLWQSNRIGVAQEHYCTAATQLVMSQLYPLIFSTPRNGMRLVAACVQGDLHELGLRMVSDLFELDGWDTLFLGANTPSEGIVETLRRKQPHLLAVSATMVFHLRGVTDLIRRVRDAGIGIPILVGGYAFNQAANLWRIVGADASAPDASEAVRVALELTRGAAL